jgi:hypothetical protein
LKNIFKKRNKARKHKRETQKKKTKNKKQKEKKKEHGKTPNQATHTTRGGVRSGAGANLVGV